jgi:2-dehydropantoate 2-reductase
MRIAVMGAGSIGGYFGGMLARGGNDVTLIARGANLRAIKSAGLKIVTGQGELPVECRATDDPAEVGPVELVLLTVKTYHNREAVPAMTPLVSDATTVLCLQNGIDSYRAAAYALGQDRVMPGAAYIEAGLPEPGVVRQTGAVVRIEFGETGGGDSDRGRRILDTLEQSGIPARFNQDIHRTLWTKFLFIATMAGTTTLARQTLAELMPRPEWRRVVVGCMQEIEAVGRATGIALPSNVVDDTLAYMEGSLEQMHASMHSDIVAGRPLELEALNGAVIRAGREAGVHTPINDVIYAMLKPWADGSPG